MKADVLIDDQEELRCSTAFYRRLGYTEVRPLPSTGTLDEGRAYGLGTPLGLAQE